MSAPASHLCPRCGQPLPDDAPRGLCPACLMAGAMETEPVPAAAMPAPEPEMLAGAFPQFKILEPIGAGGMGRVYKVHQPHLDRVAALKILPPALAADPEWVERFHREARALARLNHPHIVQVYDFGEAAPAAEGQPPLPYLCMEYVDGVNLRQAMQAGSLTAREALAIVPKLCDALQYAHERGVLHRDLKPENILMDGEGRVKIADFGLAKFVHQDDDSRSAVTLTQAGARMGTAAYMAPEQIEHPQDVDHRADIYSLGVVFYEMLTGGLPLGRFPAPSESHGVDPRLDSVVFRTLEKQRERRYQSAGEVKTGLQQHLGSAPTESGAAGVARRKQGRPLWWWVLVGLLVVLGLVAAGLAIPFFLGLSKGRPAAPRVLATESFQGPVQTPTRITVDGAITHDGHGSIKIEAVQGATITVAAEDRVQPPSGGTVWCRAQLRCENLKGTASLVMHLETAGGAQLYTRSPAPISGTTDWREVLIPMRMNPDAAVKRLAVNLVIQGEGTVWVDEIQITHEAAHP